MCSQSRTTVTEHIFKMHITKVLLSVVFVVVACVPAMGDLGDSCTADSDCTGANNFCQPLFTNCNTGTCACKTGFVIATLKDCQPPVSYGQSCNNSINACTVGQCTAGKCTCTSPLVYNTVSNRCIQANKKALTEACTTDSDCLSTGVGVALKCTGSGNSKTCTCPAGYIAENFQCRSPHVGESCTGSCVPMVTLQDYLVQGNQQTETCQNGACACPANTRQISATLNGIQLYACQNTYSGALLADGAACTQSNACASGLCFTCGGKAICVSTISGNGAVVKQLSPWILLLFITSRLL